MRKLSPTFMNDLLSGRLNVFLQHVQQDDTLCLEIREEYVNIYYRGGSLFRIAPTGNGYAVSFDMNYASRHAGTIAQIGPSAFAQWVDSIPLLKAEMDAWFFRHPKLEREYQQLVLRENNQSCIAGDTDYYIADIEYANTENKSRFDLIGIKWLSTAASRKKADDVRLVFFEMKYGDGALAGTSGLGQHYEDLHSFLSDQRKLATIRSEAESQINQKVQLGLLPSIGKPIRISDEKPEFILLLANHKPVKSVLERELRAVRAESYYADLVSRVDIRVASASFLGYGLYDACMTDMEALLHEGDGDQPQ